MSQAGEPVHVAQVFAIALDAVALPDALPQPLEHAAFLRGPAERGRRPRGGQIGLRCRHDARREVAPQSRYPRSMPVEQRGRRARRGRGRQRGAGRAHRLCSLVGERPHARGLGPLPRQSGPGGLFLAPSQLEHRLGPEAEGAHRL